MSKVIDFNSHKSGLSLQKIFISVKTNQSLEIYSLIRDDGLFRLKEYKITVLQLACMYLKLSLLQIYAPQLVVDKQMS